jgi:hypothetical protein
MPFEKKQYNKIIKEKIILLESGSQENSWIYNYLPIFARFFAINHNNNKSKYDKILITMGGGI